MKGKDTLLALQSISCQKLREYTKHGNSAKFRELKKKKKERIKTEGKRKLKKAIREAGKKGNWMEQKGRDVCQAWGRHLLHIQLGKPYRQKLVCQPVGRKTCEILL